MATLTLTNPLYLVQSLAPGQWGQVDLQAFVSGLNPATITWLAPRADDPDATGVGRDGGRLGRDREQRLHAVSDRLPRPEG